MFETTNEASLLLNQVFGNYNASGAGQEALLFEMINQGNLNGVNNLLSMTGIDVDQQIKYGDKTKTALMLAILGVKPELPNSLKIVEALLKANADPNLKAELSLSIDLIAKNRLPWGAVGPCDSEYENSLKSYLSPLAYATLSGNNEVVLLLIRYGADVNEKSNLPFRINTPDYKSTSPVPVLHLAIQNCSSAVVKTMLDKGADKYATAQHFSNTLVWWSCICCFPAHILMIYAVGATCGYLQRQTRGCMNDLHSSKYNAIELAATLGKNDIRSLLETHNQTSPPLLNSQPFSTSNNGNNGTIKLKVNQSDLSSLVMK